MVLFNRYLILLFLFFSVQVSAQTFKDIAYGTDDKQTLDIYVPDGKPPVDGFPVHVFVHGGAWNIGDKSTVKLRHATAYNKQNIILLSVNYRLAPDNKFPDFVEDIALASAWIHRNIGRYGGNQNAMLLSGHSAGAHMVALVGIAPKYLQAQNLSLAMWQAVVPVDTASFDLIKKQEGAGARLVERMKSKAFGDSPQVLREASPLYQVQANSAVAPFYLYATAERQDAVQANFQLAEKLRRNGYQAQARALGGDLSHADMRKLIFDSDSEIFQRIVSLLK
ncbi:Alpha/beta hydrolase [uncultured Thiomicrorhabdus sp.]